MVTVNKKIFVLCIVEGSALIFDITILPQGIHHLNSNLPIRPGINFELGDDFDETKLYSLLKVKKEFLYKSATLNFDKLCAKRGVELKIKKTLFKK